MHNLSGRAQWVNSLNVKRLSRRVRYIGDVH